MSQASIVPLPLQSGTTVTRAVTSAKGKLHCAGFTSEFPWIVTAIAPAGLAATSAFHCDADSTNTAVSGVAGQSEPTWNSVVVIVPPARRSVAYSVARLKSPTARTVTVTG
jgi:hypothetical protein